MLAPGHPVRGRQEVHRLHDPVELTPGDGQVARHGGAGGDDHGVEPLAQVGGREVLADLDPVAEAGALGLHLGDPAVQDRLLHLELGDAVAQQASGRVGALVDGHGVAGTGQLLGSGEPRRAGPDDRDGLAGQALRCLRGDRAVLEGAVDDADLDLLDRHGRLVDTEDAGRFTRRRAEPTGELGEVVRRVQAVDGLAPLPLPREVVPLRDEVAERAAAVAERDAAVHAAPGLPLQLGHRLLLVDLLPVLDPDRNGATSRQFTLTRAQETLGVSHGRPPCAAPTPGCRRGPAPPPPPWPARRGRAGRSGEGPG